MAKVPSAGTVKTRLQTILSPEKCSQLAAAFLEDTLKKSATICKNIILAYSPANQRELLEKTISPEITLIEQTGANLGEKMANAFETAFEDYSCAVMIGTDSPTFPARYLAESLAALEKASEIVLGKSKDGGFYLIGRRRKFTPELFGRIEWSSPLVFEQMTRNIKELGIEKLHLLPEHYDVDTPDDLLILQEEIFGDENARKMARKTYEWLRANNEANFKN